MNYDDEKFLDEAYLGPLYNTEGQLYAWVYDCAKIDWWDLPSSEGVFERHILMSKEEYEEIFSYYLNN